MGLDLDSDEKARAKKPLFVPRRRRRERGQARPSCRTRPRSRRRPADHDARVFRARGVITPSGHLRAPADLHLQRARPGRVPRRVRPAGRALPQNGLIVDVRDNGGGHIYASEFTLQTMTPRQIAPEPVQFISTPLNLRICRRHKDNPAGIDLGPWFDSLDLATETGAAYSAAKPITPVDGANEIGQRTTARSC